MEYKNLHYNKRGWLTKNVIQPQLVSKYDNVVNFFRKNDITSPSVHTTLLILKLDGVIYKAFLDSLWMKCKHIIPVSSPCVARISSHHSRGPPSPPGKVKGWSRASSHFSEYRSILFNKKQKGIIYLNQFALIIEFLQTFSIKYSFFLWKIIYQNDIRCTNVMRPLSTLPSPVGKGDHASGGWGEETESLCLHVFSVRATYCANP